MEKNDPYRFLKGKGFILVWKNLREKDLLRNWILNVILSVSRILTNWARWDYLVVSFAHFSPLFKLASFFEAAEAASKIVLNLNQTTLSKFNQVKLVQVCETLWSVSRI